MKEVDGVGVQILKALGSKLDEIRQKALGQL